MGELRHPERHIATRIDDWRVHMSHLRRIGIDSISGATMCEIGTGWYPIMPVCFYLAGSRQIFSTDIHHNISESAALKAIVALEPHLTDIAQVARVGGSVVRERYNRLKNATGLDAMLDTAGITYWHGHQNGRMNGVPARSIDIAFSNNVLEHVPANEIIALARDTAAALKPGGVVSHAVACNDHYANFDSEISFINFLQYSDEDWRKWDNGLLWQNRLRAPDFLSLCETPATPIAYRHDHTHPGSIDAIRNMRLDDRFRRYSIEDLAVTSLHIIARAN